MKGLRTLIKSSFVFNKGNADNILFVYKNLTPLVI